MVFVLLPQLAQWASFRGGIKFENQVRFFNVLGRRVFQLSSNLIFRFGARSGEVKAGCLLFISQEVSQNLYSVLTGRTVPSDYRTKLRFQQRTESGR
jgi:hypothetical protein